MHAAFRRDTFQFRIPGDPKYVSMVRRAMRTIAIDLGFAEDVIWKIEVSVAEALANAVEHGSPGQNRNNVVVACTFEAGKLTIDVMDEGPGFALPNSDEIWESLDERGRGLRMIYELMDNVKVSRSRRGSRLRMVKTVQPERAAGNRSRRAASRV
jgi:anti-sigma regulatory factor (Ser/Thr protein kinase)